MAGILDSKTRIFDTILTSEGRRQLAAGTFKIEFASFSDSATFYERDAVSGSSDAGVRIFFEAASSQRDQITFETDDAGVLVPYTSAGSIKTVGSKIVSGTTIISNGTTFASVADTLLSSSLDNYKNLYLLGTEDIFLDTGKFEVSRDEVNFILTDKVPLDTQKDITQASINSVESFYQDKRLSHIPNFKYLPPVNKGTENPIGSFPCQGQEEILTYDQLLSEMGGKESAEITFPSTSRENNLTMQLFELSNGNLQKLDVIDFGEFTTDDDSPVKQVFFVGKIFEDELGNGTFVNLFVLIFD